MTSLLALTSSRPIRSLAPDEILLVQGEGGGDLFVLESGRLSVERDGVGIAIISTPNTLIGEMSVLLGTRNSATVRAETATRLRVIRDARAILESDPALALQVAALVAGRLDATSALLVNLSQTEKSAEPSLFKRILSALHVSAE